MSQSILQVWLLLMPWVASAVTREECLFLNAQQDSEGEVQVSYSTCRPEDRLSFVLRPADGEGKRFELKPEQRTLRASKFDLRVPTSFQGKLVLERLGKKGELLEVRELVLPFKNSRVLASVEPSCIELRGIVNMGLDPEVQYSTCNPKDRLRIRIEPERGQPSIYEFTDEQKSTKLRNFALHVPIDQTGTLTLERMNQAGVLLERKSVTMPFEGPVIDELPKKYERKKNTVRFAPLLFRVGPTVAMQSGRACGSATLSWNPELIFNSKYSIGLSFGVTPLSNELNESFVESHAQIMFGRMLSPRVGAELGGGIQNWSKHGGTYPLLSGGLVFHFEQKALNVFDRAFLGYSGYLTPQHYTHEFRLGLGLSF